MWKYNLNEQVTYYIVTGQYTFFFCFVCKLAEVEKGLYYKIISSYLATKSEWMGGDL